MLLRILAGVIITLGIGGCASTREYAEALGSEDVEQRRAAALELDKMGRRARWAVEELREATGDPDPEVRRRVVKTLGDIGKPAFPAATEMIHCMRDEDSLVRREAVLALVKLENFPANAFPGYYRTLGDPDSMVREFTLSAFLDLGTPAVPTLRRALKDTSAIRRRTAARTLGMLGEEGKSAVYKLQEVVEEDPDETVRAAAEQAIARIEGVRLIGE